MAISLSEKYPVWLPPVLGLLLSAAINLVVIFTLTFTVPHVQSESDEIDLAAPVEVQLAAPRNPAEECETPLTEPVPFASAFAIQNNLPTDIFSKIQPDEKKINGLLDAEDGGSQLRPEGIRSGGGGGDGADSLVMGHVATEDRVWARMKWKSDHNAKEVAAGDDNGRGMTVPGVLKNPGGGSGLGNGTGSGALGSQGSGTGSGAGVNGSGIGTGLGTAPPLAESRKPGVISMTRGIYPPSARAAHHEGTVTLSVEVLPAGAVGKVEVKTSSGYGELDQAAVDAARDWRFTGALKDGKPVSFWYAIPYRFTLTE